MKPFYLSAKLTYSFCIFILAYFILNPSEAASATVNAVLLWANNVLPNVFIFGIASGIALKTGILSDLKFAQKILAGLNIETTGVSSYMLSIVCASPLSIKNVCELYKENALSKEDAQHLLVLCSTLSPLFLYSSIGMLMYQNYIYAISLLAVNYVGSYISAYVYRIIYKTNSLSPKEVVYQNQNFISFIPAFTSSVTTATDTAITVGGFVVFFGVIISAFTDFFIFPDGSIFAGICKILLEITSGANALKGYLSEYEILIMSISYATVGFGGMCFLMQNLSFITKTNLSVKRFVWFKLLNALINICLGNITLAILKTALNI